MWNSRGHRLRLLVLCVAFGPFPGIAKAQGEGLVFDQIVGRPRGLPVVPPEGAWVEVINVTPRWVVIQNQFGQQYPIGTGDLGRFLARWPISLEALGNQSMVQAFGQDLGSNVVETPHVDVFEGSEQTLIAPTYYNSLLPTSSMILRAWDYYGQSALYGWSFPNSPSMMGAPVRLHVVGNVVNQEPLRLGIPGNNIATVVPPAGQALIVTRLTMGSVSHIRKGDFAFLVPRAIGPKGLVLSEFLLYKTTPFPLLEPAR